MHNISIVKLLCLVATAGRYRFREHISQPLLCSERAGYGDTGRYGGFFHVQRLYCNIVKNYTLSGAILNKLYIFAPERV